MSRCFIWFILLVIILPVGTAYAQDDTASCPTMVETALQIVSDACYSTERNSACYGHDAITVTTFQDDLLEFASPGDQVSITHLQSLVLDPFDADAGLWGISLMRVQASLPDTLPGQNVAILLFGDVQITRPSMTQWIDASVTGDSINIRAAAATSAPVVGQLSRGTQITATGRNNEADWIRIRTPDGGDGWAAAFLLQSDTDWSALPETAAEEPLYGPMQAFYFQSGIGNNAPCAEAPDSGILIRTPEGTAKIQFSINEISIQLGSTAYLQAVPDDVMSIYILEGEAIVTAFDESQTVIAGSWVTVPIDEELAASGPPSDVEPFDQETLGALPLTLLGHADGIEPVTSIGTEIVCLVLPNKEEIYAGPGYNYQVTARFTFYQGMGPDFLLGVIGSTTGEDGDTWFQVAGHVTTNNWQDADPAYAGWINVNDIAIGGMSWAGDCSLLPGFVATDSLQSVPAETQANVLTIGGQALVFVTDQGLSLRSGPGINFERLEYMPFMTVVDIIGGPQTGDGYIWWQVRSPTGNEGWAVESADGMITLIPIANP